jgi:hypothetical protein
VFGGTGSCLRNGVNVNAVARFKTLRISPMATCVRHPPPPSPPTSHLPPPTPQLHNCTPPQDTTAHHTSRTAQSCAHARTFGRLCRVSLQHQLIDKRSLIITSFPVSRVAGGVAQAHVSVTSSSEPCPRSASPLPRPGEAALESRPGQQDLALFLFPLASRCGRAIERDEQGTAANLNGKVKKIKGSSMIERVRQLENSIKTRRRNGPAATLSSARYNCTRYDLSF